MKLKVYILLILFIILFSCVNSNSNNKIQNQNLLVETTKISHANDTVISIKYDCCFIVSTSIKYPPENISIKGNILLLHGWNLPAQEWCEKTSFCEKALQNGYVLIIPDYGKSNYILEIYPQTNPNYIKYPTLTWILEEHIPIFQNELGILLPGQNNFVAGISTGARGASLLAYYKPEIFKAIASLSGDFNICTMPEEYLYYSFLGHYSDFPERWKKECFAYDCKNFKPAIYIAHGEADKTSPAEQSKMMYDSLKNQVPKLNIKANFKLVAGHNYEYWESETDNVLKFFEEIK